MKKHKVRILTEEENILVKEVLQENLFTVNEVKKIIKEMEEQKESLENHILMMKIILEKKKVQDEKEKLRGLQLGKTLRNKRS